MAFFAENANTDIRSFDHIDVIAAVADCKRCFVAHFFTLHPVDFLWLAR
jgi:hypothetical protein